MTMMIGLVGDQPLPNFLAVKHFHAHVDQVLLVYTDEKREEKRKLEAILQQKLGVDVKEVETEAHNVSKIAQRLREKLKTLHIGRAEGPIFNVTGGTKAMSLAASQIAQEFDAQMMYIASQKRDVCAYHSRWANNVCVRSGDEIIPACITLENVFDMHLGMKNWETCGPSEDIGGRFEKLLAGVLEKQKGVDEVISGVRTLNRQIEIDIAIRLGNHYGIIEAKSGENGRKMDGVKQLCTAIHLLSTYARPFHVITVPANDEHKQVREAVGITSISLQSYDKDENTISKDDEIELMARIKHAFEVPGVFSAYD